MMNSWTIEDIEAILIQLDNQKLPFKKYRFTALGKGLQRLGKGAFSQVYEAMAGEKAVYAIKVIGFGDKHADSESFQKSVQAQKELGMLQEDIVKIYDSTQLRVFIEGDHEVVKIQSVGEEDSSEEGNYLDLQFVVMEKVTPILQTNKFKHTLSPYKLSIFDEQEILALAYDIGKALARAHEKNIIHRDIKPENIFFDSKSKRYKLGDFGIARTTNNGLASTVAFTKGYGAPEVVGTLEDKYDCTADIYSFGMMLYVLLNELRFPESKNYHPNIFQYSQGYVAPEPVRGSDELSKIVLKMISFDPDDRYQSMDEVLNELEKIKYGRGLKYQREHKRSALILGTLFALSGAITWKLFFAPTLELNLTFWMYIALALCIGKGALSAFKKDTFWINLGILGIGIYWMITTGFSIWKLLLILALSLIGDVVTGVFGLMVILVDAVHILISRHRDFSFGFEEFRWVAVLLLSLAVVLITRHYLLSERDVTLTNVYLRKKGYWVSVIAAYVSLILTSIGIDYLFEFMQSHNLALRAELEELVKGIISWRPMLVGVLGIAFCILWIGRECFLVYIEKQREKR